LSNPITEQLKAMLEKIDSMSPAEFSALFDASELSEDDVKQYAALEKMLLGETVDGWRLGEPID